MQKFAFELIVGVPVHIRQIAGVRCDPVAQGDPRAADRLLSSSSSFRSRVATTR